MLLPIPMAANALFSVGWVPMLSFLLESLTKQLVCLVMRRDAIKETDTSLMKLKEKWVKDGNYQ